MAQALLGLGSNLGNRDAMLDAAVESLDSTTGVRMVARSRWHSTKPVGGPPGQDDYLNGAVLIETTLEPLVLLRQVRQIETQFGRQRQTEVRWGPRTLDIDLLLYDDRVVDTPELEIPHPRMAERRFVLEPTVEIAANWVHPVRKTSLAELLRRLDQTEPPAVE
jgi:2-amino-4-hydroxy-6-hydroxymethyldihydropteridine diphosphokinase